MHEASQKLCITQPSLSESIKRLEDDLKMTVFYRSRSGIQLTPSGRTLFEKASEIFSRLNDVDSNQNDLSKTNKTTIIIGCHPMVSAFVLPKVLADFEKHAHGFRLAVVHDVSHKIQFYVQSGSVDIALIVNPVPAPDLIMKKCLLDEMCIWQSNNNCNFDRIICDNHSFHSQAMLKKWKKNSINILSSDNLDLNTRLTAEGLGYGILPRRGVRMLGFENKLKLVPNTPTCRIDVSIVHKPVFGRNAFERLFIETIKKTLAKLNRE